MSAFLYTDVYNSSLKRYCFVVLYKLTFNNLIKLYLLESTMI